MDISALRRRIMARRQEGQAQQRQQPLMADKSRVARVLFDPPDHEANLRFVKRELEKAKREAEDRWNFDFENEKPIEGGRFEWVPPTRPLPCDDDVTTTSPQPSEQRLSPAAPSSSSSSITSQQQQPATSSAQKVSEDSINSSSDQKESRVVSTTTSSSAVPAAASAAATAATVCDKKSAEETDENREAPVPVVSGKKKPSSAKPSSSVQSTPRKETPSTSRSRLKQNQITSKLTEF